MPTTKPNILIIWGDDIGWYNVSAYNLGLIGYRTPNIDRVFTAERGGAAVGPRHTFGAVVGQSRESNGR